MEDVGYMNILSGGPRSVFQDFESFLRTEIDLVEDDIRLVLHKYNSSFLTYELDPGLYTLKDLSEALFKILQHEYPSSNSEILIEYNDITLKTQLFVESGTIAIRFDGKSFFNTVLGFNHGWDYKHYKDYTSQKNVNLGNTNNIHLKCDVIDSSVVN